MKTLISLFLLLQYTFSALPPLHVEKETRKIVNSNGEEVILHGVNVVYKNKPWHPTLDENNWSYNTSFTQRDIGYLKSWGFNVVRLGVMWPGVIDSSNNINSTYLDTMKKIVEDLGNNGIYTLVDMHQDLLSEYFCGEGIPNHLMKDVSQMKTFPWPLGTEFGGTIPTREQCIKYPLFGTYYATKAVNYAFEELYKKNSTLYNELHRFWKVIAESFKGNTNVLGFELINEPNSGNIYRNPLEFLDLFGRSGHKYLEPLYQSLAKLIWSIDPERNIVFESTGNSPFTSGFVSAPGGKSKVTRQIFSHHVYCPLVDWSGCPRLPKICPVFDNLMMYLRYMESQYFGSGLLLTEFGALSQDKACVEETHNILSRADALGEGWIYWQYKQFDDPTTANMDGTQGFFNIRTDRKSVVSGKSVRPGLVPGG